MTLLKKRYRIVLEVNYLYNSFYGKIEEIADTKVIINVNDIGYEINMPENHITKIIDKKEEKVKIYTHFHVREDDMRLFGFLEKSTLNFFEKLISVSGVGPKVALGTISNINVEEFREIIKGRKFIISFGGYEVSEISDSYMDVDDGELLALFNTSGLLEIAQNNGHAASVLGISFTDNVKIIVKE